MRRVDFLLVGGGLASATAAETLREEGETGSILILGSEPEAPYHRPALSKGFLLGKTRAESLHVLGAKRLRELDINVLRATTAVALDPEAHVVRTDPDGGIAYGKLLIATGAAANTLDVPGAALPGVLKLRTLADARALKKAAAKAKAAVVVGGSFVGMEAASSLASLGIAVTIVAQEPVLLAKLGAPQVSRFFLDLYEKKNVTIRLGETVTGLEGEARVRAARTSGGATLPCDLLVVGVGVTPCTSFLEGSGIAVQDGVLVDRLLRTSKPDVFAAGDVASVLDPQLGRHVRVEHWDSAVKQGRVAARNMLGQRRIYDELSYFYCDVFDTSFESLGQAGAGMEEIHRGSLERRSYALFHIESDIIRGLFTMGRPAEETRAAEALIRYRVNIADMKPSLADLSYRIDHIPGQTVLILQGGGAMGAFECGVVRALEERAIRPDIVAGVSIGAFNGAIIAAHPEGAAPALEAFWDELSVLFPDWAETSVDEAILSWQTIAFGLPKFFRPRWTMPAFSLDQLPYRWTSLYDTAPMRALLERFVDFRRLKSSPVRLLVSAVNVETAELEIFDSYSDDLTADHILASGSLPPGFPWTTIGGRHYWDGGIVSNSPLEFVAERCGSSGKRIIIVDLYASQRALPSNLMEVIARRDEIAFAERVRRDVVTRDLIRDYGRLVEDLLAEIEPARASVLRQRPRYVQLMGSRAEATITRIVREPPGNEIPGRDFDFSQGAVRRNRQLGHATTVRALDTRPDTPANAERQSKE